jgi:hypothetical protein
MVIVKENQEATIGNPSFSGKTKKVKVGDKAELQGEEVEITKIDYTKPGSGATSNKIIAKTKDGKQVSAKAAMFKPLDEVKIEDVKSLLSNETIKQSDIGTGSDNDVVIIYDDYKKLPSEDLNKLRNSFIVDADLLSDEGETEVYQYFISNKMNEVMKPDSKLKLKELVRKMMKEMFDGRDNLTDIE